MSFNDNNNDNNDDKKDNLTFYVDELTKEQLDDCIKCIKYGYPIKLLIPPTMDHFEYEDSDGTKICYDRNSNTRYIISWNPWPEPMHNPWHELTSESKHKHRNKKKKM